MVPTPVRKTRFRKNSEGLVEEFDPATGEVLAVESAPNHWNPPPAGYKPLVFSPILSDQIIEEIENGMTLSKVLKRPGMPRMSTILLWAENNPEFGSRLERARKTQSVVLYDKVMEIAERAEAGLTKAEIDSLKLASDIFKWGAEKADQERYGSKKSIQDSGVVIVISTGIDRSEPTTIEVTQTQDKDIE